MVTRFTYALILTPFERNYLGTNRANWFYVVEQDFPLHVLFCHSTKEIIFFGDNLSNPTSREIDLFLLGLEKSGI